MKYRKHVIAALLALTLLGMVGWRARHRVRAYLERSAEQKSRQGLLISSENANSTQTPASPIRVLELDWPWWRGPHYNNHTSGPLPPLAWSETENILWKIGIPGRGHSSPCVLGDRIFLTTAEDDEGIQKALCVEASSGKLLWSTQVHKGTFIYANTKNSQASSTVATDGLHAFAVFAIENSIWLTSLSLDGDIEWQCEAGPYFSKEGYGASPQIAGDFVIVAADNVGQSWISAVHRESGQLTWRIPRGPGTSYASPTMLISEGKDIVTMAGLDRIVGIDPETGQELWTVTGPNMSASTPVVGDGMLFATGCTQDSGLFGIRLGESPQLMWNLPFKAEVPSPLYSDGLVYIAQDIGILMCVEATTGEQVWRKRLGSNISSSPVLTGDYIMCGVEDGRVFVLKKGREYQEVSVNQIESEGLYASPSISNGRIFLRTVNHLYAIGQTSSDETDASPRASTTQPSSETTGDENGGGHE